MEESFSALFGGRGDAQDVHRTIANKVALLSSFFPQE